MFTLIPGFNFLIINKKIQNSVIKKKKFSKVWFLHINDIK